MKEISTFAKQPWKCLSMRKLFLRGSENRCRESGLQLDSRRLRSDPSNANLMDYLPEQQIPPRYLKELPPRRLDIITQAVLFCGDAASQVGWVLLAMGSVFFWVVAINSEARTWVNERNVDWQSKAGFVIAADSLIAQEHGEKIWKYRHSFALDDYRYFGESYSVGRKFDAGQIAYIRYDANNPNKNYMVGLRRNEFSSKADWFLIVPIFGLLLLFCPCATISR